MNRYRDYAFTETHGGTKGEKADYMIIDGGKTNDLGQMRYLPINSRIKLNKHFRSKLSRNEMEEEEDEQKVKNIVIAPRSLTKGEVANIRSSFDLAGRPKEEMTKPMVPLFERNKDVTNVEIKQSNALKSLFIIPKEFEGLVERRQSLEQEDAKMDEDSDSPKRKVQNESNDDAGYSDSNASEIFGHQSQEQKVKPESKKSAAVVEDDESEDDDDFAEIF